MTKRIVAFVFVVILAGCSRTHHFEKEKGGRAFDTATGTECFTTPHYRYTPEDQAEIDRLEQEANEANAKVQSCNLPTCTDKTFEDLLDAGEIAREDEDAAMNKAAADKVPDTSLPMCKDVR